VWVDIPGPFRESPGGRTGIDELPAIQWSLDRDARAGVAAMSLLNVAAARALPGRPARVTNGRANIPRGMLHGIRVPFLSSNRRPDVDFT